MAPALDAFDKLLGRDRDLVPPRRLIGTIGQGDFQAIGDEFLGHFRSLADLTPSDAVLDIGCGVGRMAVPLSRFLSEGSYEGFDIIPACIQWCQEQITPRFPNFRFQLADIHNDEYHPAGRGDARTYRFPYDDSSFDFAFATSVFTHMQPTPVDNYLSETARVLRPGGRLVATFFLLNDESQSRIAAGTSGLDMRHDLREEGTDLPFATTNVAIPEAALGLPEPFVRDSLQRHGFEVDEPIRYGSWSGRERYLSYQDVLVARTSAS